jgi:hypothetical protein
MYTLLLNTLLKLGFNRPKQKSYLGWMRNLPDAGFWISGWGWPDDATFAPD